MQRGEFSSCAVTEQTGIESLAVESHLLAKESKRGRPALYIGVLRGSPLVYFLLEPPLGFLRGGI
jgi:hypothetical protein